MTQTPLQQAIHHAELKLKEMKGQNWRTPIEIAIQSVHVNDLKSLLPKEREFVRDNFRTGYNLSQHKQGLIGMEQPTLTEYLNQLYPEK